MVRLRLLFIHLPPIDVPKTNDKSDDHGLVLVVAKPVAAACTFRDNSNTCFVDIIDGFGSYPHHFMSAPVFCGVGSVAFKYYMLFQHQSVPSESQAEEPSWLLGAAPGPYINQLSRSVFMFLGKHVAFLGLDCRTERMVRDVPTFM